MLTLTSDQGSRVKRKLVFPPCLRKQRGDKGGATTIEDSIRYKLITKAWASPQCGEGINFRREVRRDGKVLCRACAGESYYTVVGR
jgi:hypothetical protein